MLRIDDTEGRERPSENSRGGGPSYLTRYSLDTHSNPASHHGQSDGIKPTPPFALALSGSPKAGDQGDASSNSTVATVPTPSYHPSVPQPRKSRSSLNPSASYQQLGRLSILLNVSLFSIVEFSEDR